MSIAIITEDGTSGTMSEAEFTADYAANYHSEKDINGVTYNFVPNGYTIAGTEQVRGTLHFKKL